MGLFSFIGGLLGGGSQKKAAEQATAAQTAAFNRAIDIQNNQYNQTRQDYMPYTTAGNNAIQSLDELIRLSMGGGNGTPPTRATDEMLAAQAELEARVKGMPLYQSMYRNGEEAILQNAAATGGLRGGNTQRGLADFGSDVLSNVYQQTLANLGQVANLGLGATGSVANFGANTANATSNLTSAIGSAQANNYLARGRINAQNWQNAGGFLDNIAGAGTGGGFSLSSALKSIFG